MITLDDLRRFAVERNFFEPTTLKRALQRMSFVQADPIRSPARAQDLILRHRVKNYHAGDLERRYAELDIEEDFFVIYGFVTESLHALMHPRSDARAPEDDGGRRWPAKRRKQAELLLEFVRSRGVVHPREVDEHFSHGKVVNYWGGSSNATTHLMDAMHYAGMLRVVRREKGIRIYAVREKDGGGGAGGNMGGNTGGKVMPGGDVGENTGGGVIPGGNMGGGTTGGNTGGVVMPGGDVGGGTTGGTPVPRPVPRPLPRPVPRPVPRPLPRPVPRPLPRVDALVDVVVKIYGPLPSSSLAFYVRRLRYAAPQWRAELPNALLRAKERLSHARVDRVDWYWPADESATRNEVQDKVRLLAPFDPVVHDRTRFELLWNWVYRFEAYTPAPKRKLGYYAMPLLWRDRVIGWANLSVKSGELVSDFGYVASGPPRERAFKRELEAELNRIREFLAADKRG